MSFSQFFYIKLNYKAINRRSWSRTRDKRPR